MRSLTGHTSVHHAGKHYQPGKDGMFDVEDAHVEVLRSHGLMLEGDANSAEAAAISAKNMESLQSENEALKRQLAENSLAEENERLRAQLAELQGKGKKASKEGETGNAA